MMRLLLVESIRDLDERVKIDISFFLILSFIKVSFTFFACYILRFLLLLFRFWVDLLSLFVVFVYFVECRFEL
jgi:hypothetical protein